MHTHTQRYACKHTYAHAHAYMKICIHTYMKICRFCTRHRLTSSLRFSTNTYIHTQTNICRFYTRNASILRYASVQTHTHTHKRTFAGFVPDNASILQSHGWLEASKGDVLVHVHVYMCMFMPVRMPTYLEASKGNVHVQQAPTPSHKCMAVPNISRAHART